jgi:hypothetical protein
VTSMINYKSCLIPIEKSVFALYLCCSFSICGGARSESQFLFRSQAECPLDLISSRLIFFVSVARRCSVFLAASLCRRFLLVPCDSRVRFPVRSPKDFRLLFFCAVSHWSARPARFWSVKAAVFMRCPCCWFLLQAKSSWFLLDREALGHAAIFFIPLCMF